MAFDKLKRALGIVRDDEPTVPGKPTRSGARCRNCKHFDLELGQKQMQKNKAFMAVTEVLEPWEVAQQAREWKANPAYTDCRKRLNAKLEELNLFQREPCEDTQEATLRRDTRLRALDLEVRELQTELDGYNPEILDETQYQELPSEVRNATWEQFGACLLLSEGRLEIDSCEQFELPEVQHVPLR